MKKLHEILFLINYYYSILWIAATGTDKHEYRNKSKIHRFLISVIFENMNR